MFYPTLFVSLLAVAARPAASHELQWAAAGPMLGKFTPLGCVLSTPFVATVQSSNFFNTVGLCAEKCKSHGHPLAALQSTQCLCSDLALSILARTTEDRCNVRCPGYPSDKCGGPGVYSLWATGLELKTEDDTRPTSGDRDIWTDVSDAAYDAWAAGGRLAGNIHRFFNKCLGRQKEFDAETKSGYYTDGAFVDALHSDIKHQAMIQ